MPELQSRAIQYLGANGSRESRATLAEIYGSSTDVDVKRRILRAFMAAGEKDRLLTAAQTETELRAPRRGRPPARRDGRQRRALADVSEGNVGRSEAADPVGHAGQRQHRADGRSRQDREGPELRRIAVRNLGVMGGSTRRATRSSRSMRTEKDPAIRRQVINSLFSQGNATALVALARKEQDMTMKTEMVKRLSNMDSKEARDYMVELLK